MSEQRGYRKTREGLVVSNKMDKTIVVEIKTRVRHPLYGKIMNQTSKLQRRTMRTTNVASATVCA